MTKEQRKKYYLLPLKVRKSGLAAKWAAKTGGVNGKKGIMHGIETIVMPKVQVMKIFLEELSKIIAINFEQIAKYRQMQNLQDQMQSFALKKLQLGL